ncbi:MAG: transporter substrate-binding domain-containing protein [Wenzhouxiangellaceae bacterium]|nr:transporter substrate-binding domain-containing protein [Wenzhouxiangellaceae bacterium]MBS3747356.1 transporter substrate-binding domain-containing protein [Wenzhouxiangellaceae bacterium]MBS3822969.1 transporter substrate-binding domain-containing protein [Wenzhouxiangellaceae bacterium]
MTIRDAARKWCQRASTIGLACLAAGMLLAAADTLAQEDQLDLDVTAPWTGDLPGMLERRVVRVLVPYSRTLYFLDGPDQRGIVYEIMDEFENVLNQGSSRNGMGISVMFLPTTRDQLLPALIDGRGDVAAANLTITPQRRERVAFTRPLGRNVAEVVVGHSESSTPGTLSDLSGQTVLLNPQSSYFEHLQTLNRELESAGKAPVEVHPAPDHFETEDILEMINAGLVDYTVADNYIARFWAQVLPRIRIHEDVALSEGNEIAFAVRRDADEFRQVLNGHLDSARKGTLLGNILFDRYYRDTRFVTGATQSKARRRFFELAQLFRKYAEQNELDWLMIAAQGYQESRLDHSVVSPAGAVGVMQLLPATAADMGIDDITDLESNVLAGARYVRYLIDNFFSAPQIDSTNRLLFALAAYNGGPGRIRRLRRLADERGLDPNVWFNNVERVVAEKIGRETVQYVSNIFKYYVAYRLIAGQDMIPDMQAGDGARAGDSG